MWAPFTSPLRSLLLLAAVQVAASERWDRLDGVFDSKVRAPELNRSVREHSSLLAEESGGACAVFGQGGLNYWTDCARGPLGGHGSGGKHVAFDGTAGWACEVPSFGLAICDEPKALLKLWKKSDGSFKDVSLAPLKAPVGAVHLDGKVYVACFGTWKTPHGDSGLAVVDVATGKMEAHYPFGDSTHVHNVYAFDWDGRKEIFVVNIGNPWAGPEAGFGIIRFDRAGGTFMKQTTGERVSARSAVQASETAFYAVTQEAPGRQSQLFRLERQGDSLHVVAKTNLPRRSGGDGGADVFLASPSEPESLFCTDRTQGGGKLYHYTYANGGFQLGGTFNTGNNPRYTTALPGGDILACNQDGAALSVFRGLARDPRAPNEAVKVSTHELKTPSFFLMSSLIPEA